MSNPTKGIPKTAKRIIINIIDILTPPKFKFIEIIIPNLKPQPTLFKAKRNTTSSVFKILHPELFINFVDLIYKQSRFHCHFYPRRAKSAFNCISCRFHI